MMTEEQKQKNSEMMKERMAQIRAKNTAESSTRERDIANLTPEEKAIYQRVESEDRSWEQTLDIGADINDFSLSADPFELPEPAKKLREKKEFAFRWVTRSTARLDELKSKPETLRWWPVNRTQPRSGMFDKFIDPNYGCVSREDQMLVFKPWSLFEKERAYKNRIADSQSNSASIENKYDEKGSAELVGSKKVSEGRLKVNSGDISFAGEAEAEAALGDSSVE
jgi:hypothetical protein